MIIEHIVNGSESTTFHDFSVVTSGMDLIISSGKYYRENQILFQDDFGGSITVPNGVKKYEIVLITNNEISVVQYSDIDELIQFYESTKFIDKIAWFEINEEVSSLDDVEVHVIKMVVSDED